METKKYALITGASAGIGEALAFELASCGYHLLLVARRRKDLERVCRETSALYGVEAEAIVQDLLEDGAVDRIMDRLKEAAIVPLILVNNAAQAATGAFENIAIDRQVDVLMLNMVRLTELTHAILPLMLERSAGYVLNLSSILGVCPRPGAASYSATNSYVIQFSRALNMELRHTGVRVTTVCPGTADTASMDAPVPVKSRRGEERFRIAGIAVDRMFAGPTVAATTCRNRLFLLWLRPMRWLDRMRALFYKRSPQLSVADSGEPVEETPLEA